MTVVTTGPKRDYDILVYGATGFTGKLVAKYITGQLPKLGPDFKWAIAGRDRQRLSDLLKWLQIPSGYSAPALLVADVSNEQQLKEVIASSTVLINCVGPFRYFGEPVVKACVETGTDYVDITGEPEFVDKMYVRYNDKAKSDGVKVVPCCGFDSVPADVGNLFLKQEFNKRGFTAATSTMYVGINSGSAGFKVNFATFESAVQGVAHIGELRKTRAMIKRPKPAQLGPKLTFLSKPRFDKFIQKWVVPFMGSDSAIVRMGQEVTETLRSSSKRSVDKLHPVQFQAYISMKNIWYLMGAVLFGTIMTTLPKYAWGRYLLLKFPGFFSGGIFSKKGPSELQIAQTSVTSTFVGRGYKSIITPQDSENLVIGKHEVEIITKVCGPEPGYVTTPIAVVTCALLLLEERKKKGDNIPSGVLTPAVAFGGTDIIPRLSESGVSFSVVSCRDL
ncbi:hypothetical protein HDV05_004107 [Chytridiales sp. JEL 0842]|nr:hypothetical protein HDV05_004107 [Chytridiales sp. JEL 0842]